MNGESLCKRAVKTSLFVLGINALAVLSASCSPQKMETCTILEIEPPEAELNLQDTDIEGWEVEIYCGDKAWDIPGGEMRGKFGINPKNYYSKNPQQAQQRLAELRQRLVLQKVDDNRNKNVYGAVDGNREFVGVAVNPDD